MLRKIYNFYVPAAATLVLALMLGVTCAQRSMEELPGVEPDAAGALMFGPGLNITLGAGLQGNGGSASPLDIKHGTESGQQVAWNGTANAVNRYCGDPTQRYCLFAEFEQFLTNCTTVYPGFVGTTTGAAAGCSSTAVVGHPGILNLHTGTTGTGFARIGTNATNYALGGDAGEACVEELVEILSLSTTVVEYLVRVGFMDSSNSANSVDAVQAVYDRLNGGNFWSLETRSNSNPTYKTCDGSGGTTAAPVAANTWYRLKQCVSSDGTSATLSVNGTVCATNTATIPTGATRATGIGALALNQSGSVPADINFFVDYIMATLPFGAGRP